MAKYYDNLEDAKAKLLNTVVYYDEVPVLVKDVVQDPYSDGGFQIVFTQSLIGRGLETKPIASSGFNFTRFNIGYANYAHGALWWYRLPAKQYQQGLKGNQLSYKGVGVQSQLGTSFKPSQTIELMLLNKYPDFDDALKTIRSSADEGMSVAFHKDFAMSWDKIHKDLLLEYKGKLIGHMPGNDIKLIDEFEHLYEPCKEAIGVR